MDEERLGRELDGVLAVLKEAEHNALLNGRLHEIKGIVAYHMAVLHGYDNMSDALEFIRAMYDV